MNREIKSLCYAFVSRNIEVYIPDEGSNIFIISKLFCSNCNSPWYTALQECFFCGELNYYIYLCDNCDYYISLTDSNIKKDDIKKGKVKCLKCENGILGQFCINKKCPSNIDKDIHKKIKEFGGVFTKDSPFKLSLMHCVKCGNPSNIYKSYSIYVKIMDLSRNNYQFLFLSKKEIEYCNNNAIDFIIIKLIYKNKIFYDVKSLDIIKGKNILKISKRFKNIDELVNFLFN